MLNNMNKIANIVKKIVPLIQFHGKILMVLLVGMFFSGEAFGQGADDATQSRYIDEHASLAMSQMELHRVPASITLAQALLEGGAGTSYLAINGNNHFGIKEKKDRPKPSIINPLDKQPYVRYNSVEESYLDHSLFLRERSHYASLFKLYIGDYTSWAKGLKECGYATDSGYPGKLIKLIKKHKLWKYDDLVISRSSKKYEQKSITNQDNKAVFQGVFPEQQAYIAKYQGHAITQMKKHKIPASIIMAQAIYISLSGSSALAVQANNHFGIQKKENWTGRAMENPNDGILYRRYDSVAASYEDHSIFLKTRERYRNLFSIPISDYQGWAQGLQKANYNLHPKYAEALIQIIETYNLNELDNMM